MDLAFVDLEKTVDTVPRKMTMHGYSEMDGSTRVRSKMVEAMYEKTKGRIVVGSNEFQVNISV